MLFAWLRVVVGCTPPLLLPQVLMLLGCIGLAVAFIDALISRIQGRPFFEVADGESARAE